MEHVDLETAKFVQDNYLSNMTTEQVRNVSKAAASLHTWCNVIVEYTLAKHGVDILDMKPKAPKKTASPKKQRVTSPKKKSIYATKF